MRSLVRRQGSIFHRKIIIHLKKKKMMMKVAIANLVIVKMRNPHPHHLLSTLPLAVVERDYYDSHTWKVIIKIMTVTMKTVQTMKVILIKKRMKRKISFLPHPHHKRMKWTLALIMMNRMMQMLRITFTPKMTQSNHHHHHLQKRMICLNLLMKKKNINLHQKKTPILKKTSVVTRAKRGSWTNLIRMNLLRMLPIKNILTRFPKFRERRYMHKDLMSGRHKLI
mmetsp:Transcript_4816/g.6885  ORF Transcript_4816/g.6885 Transcript_4816/m.6885 type:complete len:224 (-) Transcript_4816:2036-2707(-)